MTLAYSNIDNTSGKKGGEKPGELPLEIVDRPMRVNTVRIPEDADFHYAKSLCDDHSRWHLVYEKKASRVWTKAVGDSHLHMIKASSEFSDVSAATAYDVLQDPDYRHKWDKYMVATEAIGLLNPNNDIYYYAVGSVPPFRSRDFVMQRSWLDTGVEKYILGHSVWHDKYPPSKAHIRGTINLTVYFIRSLGEGKCQITYVTYSDPKGKLPTWFVNRLTTIIAPRLIKKLHRACVHYADWKKSHNPSNKPWLFPDQQVDCPRIDLNQCRPPSTLAQELEIIIDETSLAPINGEDDEE